MKSDDLFFADLYVSCMKYDDKEQREKLNFRFIERTLVYRSNSVFGKTKHFDLLNNKKCEWLFDNVKDSGEFVIDLMSMKPFTDSVRLTSETISKSKVIKKCCKSMINRCKI